MPHGRRSLNLIKSDSLCYDAKTLRHYGYTMAVACGILGSIVLLRHNTGYIYFYAIAIIFLVCALIRPVILKPVYSIWMKLAFVLGWFNTRVLLIIMFYGVFTPIGLIIRLSRRDLLMRAIDRDCQSYWIGKAKAAVPKKNYERQF
jgi:hypothetical protein